MAARAVLTGIILVALGAGIFGLKASLEGGEGRAQAPGRPLSMPESFRDAIKAATATPSDAETPGRPAAQATSSEPSTEQEADASPPLKADAPAAVPASPLPEPVAPAASEVCNVALLGSDGYSPRRMIDRETCEKLNALYAEGKATGNRGDAYDNRDDLHVNLCVDWTPNPDCPPRQRLFPQHGWKLSGSAGRATSPLSQPTLGQASWSGENSGGEKRGIPYAMYGSDSGAETLYRLYRANNLYVYPSLADDSYARSIYDASLLADPSGFDPSRANRANTPYVIGSKQICDCGAGSLRIHDASGSDLPFIELGFAGLAAFRPGVKEALVERGMLMPTLQAMIRYSHDSVGGANERYLSSGEAHGASATAHKLVGGEIRPAYDAGRLVDMVNGLGLAAVPPLVELSVVSETFEGGERLFDTPGAVARTAHQDEERSITIEARASSADGYAGSYEYRFEVLRDDGAEVKIEIDPAVKGKATIWYGSGQGRADVGVFARKEGGRHYSVPAIVSRYSR